MLVRATPCRAISSAAVLTIRSLVARPLGVSCRTSTSAIPPAYCRVGLVTQLTAAGFHLRIVMAIFWAIAPANVDAGPRAPCPWPAGGNVKAARLGRRSTDTASPAVPQRGRPERRAGFADQRL